MEKERLRLLHADDELMTVSAWVEKEKRALSSETNT